MLDSALKIIINKRKEESLFYALDNLKPISIFKFNDSSIINNMYIGRVQKVKHDLNAAFVEIDDNIVGFLPFSEISSNLILNRTSNGDLIENDRVLVMVNKEAVKTKPVSLTMKLCIQGEYCIVRTDNTSFNISSKINSLRKKELLELQSEIIDNCIGYTLRTKCNDATPEVIICEANELAKKLQNILSEASTRSLFTLMFKAKPSYIERIHSLNNDIKEIITDDPEIYKDLLLYFDESLVKYYDDNRISLNALYSLEKIYAEATNKTVLLKSGGSIVIEPTEALTVIDVNTGKINKKNKEEAILQINLEAAKEIARQIRLRNISGIIVIDFINFTNKSNEDKLIASLKDEIKKDPIKTSYIDMTDLGLVELTRQKKYSSIYEK